MSFNLPDPKAQGAPRRKFWVGQSRVFQRPRFVPRLYLCWDSRIQGASRAKQTIETASAQMGSRLSLARR